MKPAHRALLAAAVLAALAGPAGAGVYKWTDKDGKVHYGDRPAPDDAATVEEVNRSDVPIPLQERLRRLDTDVTIKRISGGLNVAFVCLDLGGGNRYGRGEPSFVANFKASRMGSISRAAEVGYGGYSSEYDEYGGTSGRQRKVDERCPERKRDAYGSAFTIYRIEWEPEVVNAYRTLPTQ